MITDNHIVDASVETYRRFSNNDDTEFTFLVRESIKSLEYFQDGLKEAFENRDISRMRALAYSISSELFYLKANELKCLVKEFLSLEGSSNQVDCLLKILVEVEDILSFLRRNVSQS